MTNFDPKSLFQNRGEDSKTLAETVALPWVRTAMVYSLSAMAMNGASAEQLDGARKFILTFLNLSENPQDMPSYPAKTLTTLLSELETQETQS